MVIRVDTENGFIDLSKKRVPKHLEKAMQDKFAKGKLMMTILRAVRRKTEVKVGDIYEKLVWPLQAQGDHVIDILTARLKKLDDIVDPLELDGEVKTVLKEEILRRLTPKPVKICSQIEITCFSPEGIDAIKEALRAGEECSTREIEIRVTIVASPLYTLSATTKWKHECYQLMRDACKKI